MDFIIARICGSCDGTGLLEEVSCPGCNGVGFIDEKRITDLRDALDDILDKLDDILEKLNA